MKLNAILKSKARAKIISENMVSTITGLQKSTPNELDLTKNKDANAVIDLSEYGYSGDMIASLHNMVRDVNQNDKSREEVIIGKFAELKDPTTGLRFSIPNVDPTSPNYLYEYSQAMSLLLYQPSVFQRILKGE